MKNKKVVIAVIVVVVLLICCLVSIVLLFASGVLTLNLQKKDNDIVSQSQITDAVTQNGQANNTPTATTTVTVTPTAKPSNTPTVNLPKTCMSESGSDIVFTVKLPGNWICTPDSFPNGDQLIMLAPDNSLQIIITNAPSDVPCDSGPTCKQEIYSTTSQIQLTHIYDGSSGELRGLVTGDYLVQVTYPNSEKSVPTNSTGQLLKQILGTIKH